MTITETAPSPSSAAVQVSPVFAALIVVFAVFAVWLWTDHTLNRVAIFGFVFCGWIVSLCLHEFAHAFTAYWSGDRSVAGKGYLTLNPLRYSHPVLSIAMPLFFLVIGGIGLPGGAVYIDRSALTSRPRRSLVSAAGPLTNLGLAFVLFLPFLVASSTLARHPHFQMACAALAVLELVAVFLNLLPIPPFDGFGIIEPLFADVGGPAPALPAAVVPMLFFALLAPGGLGSAMWHSAYRVGYGMGVPHGVAGDGLQLARFWTEAPPRRNPYARPGIQTPSGPAAPFLPASPSNPPRDESPHPSGSGTSSIPGPRAVVGGAVVNTERVEVTIGWQPPPGYPAWDVYRGDDDAPFLQSQECRCAGSPGHAFDTEAVAGHRYTYYVVAMSQDRTSFSRPSSITVDVPSLSTAPSAPAYVASGIPCDDKFPCGSGTSSIPSPRFLATSFRTSSEITQVIITWQPPPGFPAWKVYRSDDHAPFVWSQDCYCAGSSGQAGDSEVVAGHRYTYYVVAMNQDRTIFSHPASITVDVPLRP